MLLIPYIVWVLNDSCTQQINQGGIGGVTTSLYIAGVPSTINVTKNSDMSVQPIVLNGATVNIGTAILALPDGLIVGTQLSGARDFFCAGTNYVYNLTAAHPSANYSTSLYVGAISGVATWKAFKFGLFSAGSTMSICMVDQGTSTSPAIQCSLQGEISHVVGY